jgi:hypothetical protein
MKKKFILVSWSLKDYQENGLNAIKEAYFQALFVQQFTLLNLFKFLHIFWRLI